jgi:hypothetical protein
MLSVPVSWVARVSSSRSSGSTMTVTVVGLVAGTSVLFILQVYLSTWRKRKYGVASVCGAKRALVQRRLLGTALPLLARRAIAARGAGRAGQRVRRGAPRTTPRRRSGAATGTRRGVGPTR